MPVKTTKWIYLDQVFNIQSVWSHKHINTNYLNWFLIQLPFTLNMLIYNLYLTADSTAGFYLSMVMSSKREQITG